jgi:hypothetical protein
MACADCNQGCNCRIIAGTGAVVTGSGLPRDPYVIETVGPVSPAWTPADVAVWGTATIDLSTLDEPTLLEVSLTANVTSITLPSWPSTVSGIITLVVTNTAAFTVSWPGITTGGVSISQSTGVDMVHMIWTGQQWVTVLGGMLLA